MRGWTQTKAVLVFCCFKNKHICECLHWCLRETAPYSCTPCSGLRAGGNLSCSGQMIIIELCVAVDASPMTVPRSLAGRRAAGRLCVPGAVWEHELPPAPGSAGFVAVRVTGCVVSPARRQPAAGPCSPVCCRGCWALLEL